MNRLADKMREKSSSELKEQLLVLKKERFNLRFQKVNGQLDNTARVRKVKREIARLKTILCERCHGVSDLLPHKELS